MNRSQLRPRWIIAALACGLWVSACGGGRSPFDEDGPLAAAGAAGDGVGGAAAGGDAGAAGAGLGGSDGVGGTSGSSGSGGDGGDGGGSGMGGASGSGGTSGPGGSTSGGSNSGGSGGGDIFEDLPMPDDGPVGECVQCLEMTCKSAINGCYNNPKCLQGIQCALTDCLLGGGQGAGNLDPICLLGCFGGDVSAMQNALQSFQCLTGPCGDKCGGDLLGGGIPLGGLGGGPTPPVPATIYWGETRVPTAFEARGLPPFADALKRLFVTA